MYKAGEAAADHAAAKAGCEAKMLAIGLAHRGGMIDEGLEETGGEGRAVIIAHG
jgi:hypothetical protein